MERESINNFVNILLGLLLSIYLLFVGLELDSNESHFKKKLCEFNSVEELKYNCIENTGGLFIKSIGIKSCEIMETKYLYLCKNNSKKVNDYINVSK